MAICRGDRTESRIPRSKVYTWAKRLLVLSFIAYFVWAVRNYSEDSHSHAIKVSFPLLWGYHQIVYQPDNYDPAKAVWGPVGQAIGINDGQIIFIQTQQATYAVKFIKQTLVPEQTEYEYVEVSGSAQIVKSVSASFPSGIHLPGVTIPWSGHELGKGFIYLQNPFVPGRPSKFKIGVPFYSGDLNNYSKAVPAEVHFESLPFKVGEAPDGF